MQNRHELKYMAYESRVGVVIRLRKMNLQELRQNIYRRVHTLIRLQSQQNQSHRI